MQGRRIFIIALIVIAVVAVVALPFMNRSESGFERTGSMEERIVVISLGGVIQEGQGGFFGGGITPRYVYSQLERAAGDRAIRGVVLRVESSGGSIAASQEIAAMIRGFSKPLVVSMGDMAASGGYYISAPAQGIVAQPGTMTGSIGVISTMINTEGLYEMLGIEVETFKSGEHKDMFSREMTAEERLIMQEISDQAYGQFISDVAADRQLPERVVRQLATGQLYLGSQALELGLVDRLGGVEEAITYLAEINGFQNPVRYDFPQPSVFNQFFEYGYQVLVSLEQAQFGPEKLLLDWIDRGYPPQIRYQVR